MSQVVDGMLLPCEDRCRIALYSHDAQGLGHVRRNLAIAGALAGDGRHDVLLITGTKEAAGFPTPAGVEMLTLPALAKSRDGDYSARSLSVELDALLSMRSATMRAALWAFDPDVVVVDKHPLGIEHELRPALEVLRARGRARLVLGLREVLDEQGVVRAEWQLDGAVRVMRDWYHAIWIYGDPRVYDTAAEYGLDDGLLAKTRYTGYLGRPAGDPDHLGSPAAELAAAGRPLALCLVGGGEDGFDLAAAFAAAPLPRGFGGVIVAGPFMPRAQRRWLATQAARRPDLAVCEFLDDPAPLLARARAVVAMGGYNTICEVLHHGCRTLVVPRVRPRREQLIRAERLAERGVIDALHPDKLTSAALGDWLAAEPASGPPAWQRVDLGGLARLPRLLAELDDSIRFEAEDSVVAL
jgi:predicted glycosyltransferase